MDTNSKKECSNIHSLLYSYIDNELTEKQYVYVKNHIENCAECTSRVDNILKMKDMIKEAYAPRKQVDFSKKIMANIKYNNKYDSVKQDNTINKTLLQPKVIFKKILYVAAAASIIMAVIGGTVTYFEQQLPVSKEVAEQVYDKYEDYVLEHYTNSYVGPRHQASVISVSFEK